MSEAAANACAEPTDVPPNFIVRVVIMAFSLVLYARLVTAEIKKLPRTRARESPTLFHPSSEAEFIEPKAAALAGVNGPYRNPILSHESDLGDSLSGGILTYPIEGAFSR
jgi:hypothetical protein